MTSKINALFDYIYSLGFIPKEILSFLLLFIIIILYFLYKLIKNSEETIKVIILNFFNPIKLLIEEFLKKNKSTPELMGLILKALSFLFIVLSLIIQRIIPGIDRELFVTLFYSLLLILILSFIVNNLINIRDRLHFKDLDNGK